MKKPIMIRCIDCGFCAFYVDMGKGMRWHEIDKPTRKAFDSGKDHNSDGQNPGTGHWQYVRCNKYLQEWENWDNSTISNEILHSTLITKRTCSGFTEYRPGLMPQEHLQFNSNDSLDVQKEMEFDVFLSHSGNDDELALRIKRLLEDSGIRTFTTPGSIPSGLWNPQIEKALKQSAHLWLLLTPKALQSSIWCHHEFGYFYGHKSSMFIDVADKRLHYFEIEGNPLRPGLYSQFQAKPVSSFNDPISLARIIAESVGKDFKEPDDPDTWLLQAFSAAKAVPEIFDNFKIKSVSSSGGADLTGIAELIIETPISLVNVCSAGWHPDVKIVSQPEHQVPKDTKGNIRFSLNWQKSDNPPKTIIDSMNRQFSFSRPHDPGDEWQPLYITFENDRWGIWALVTYFNIRHHQKGFPEFSKISGSAPFGWVQAEKV